ncbi:hypothetical protein [Allomesorhizobium alhagi]|uniref:hypothetical protein n=1 Tax=Allomesorhizobium alhagi TaxID=475067 RepID=UPI0011127874|nr:hypothetical protein [Mesorhizobium alhagi]
MRMRHYGVGTEIGNSEHLSSLMSSHRSWLDRLGIRNKPWLVLGSAPDPTILPSMSKSHARIDINNSGRTAAALGFGRAALTIRARKKTWEEHRELDTRALLWIHERHPLTLRLKVLFRPHRHVGSIAKVTPWEREELIAQVASTQLKGIGSLNKVTNGVFAVCYGLALGVPEIVIAGVSLSKVGHSYDQLQRRRRQVDEDAYVLERLKEHPAVFTTEADLAAETGLRLWAAPISATANTPD